MGLTAPVSDLCQTEMLKVKGALAPRRVRDQPGMWALFLHQACKPVNNTHLSNNESLKIMIITTITTMFRQAVGKPSWVLDICVHLPGLQRRSGGVGVLGGAHSPQQHEGSNSRQTVLQQRHPEGQGQQHQHAPGSTPGWTRFHLNCWSSSIINKCVVFAYAAWWSREHRQLILQRYCVWQKSCQPSQH